MMPALTSSSVPQRAVIASNSRSNDNLLIVLVVAAHSLQLLQIPLGATGEVIGTLGSLLALVLSLLSPKTMFLMLFGVNFISLTGPSLAHLRVYILLYFVYAARLCITPSVFQLVLGNSPASRVVRRWFFAWLGFAVVVAGFFAATANDPFGMRCAWDMTRGLGTSLLACILAVLAFDKVEEDSLLPIGLVVYVLLGAC